MILYLFGITTSVLLGLAALFAAAYLVALARAERHQPNPIQQFTAADWDNEWDYYTSPLDETDEEDTAD